MNKKQNINREWFLRNYTKLCSIKDVEQFLIKKYVPIHEYHSMLEDIEYNEVTWAKR